MHPATYIRIYKYNIPILVVPVVPAHTQQRHMHGEQISHDGTYIYGSNGACIEVYR